MIFIPQDPNLMPKFIQIVKIIMKKVIFHHNQNLFTQFRKPWVILKILIKRDKTTIWSFLLRGLLLIADKFKVNHLIVKKQKVKPPKETLSQNQTKETPVCFHLWFRDRGLESSLRMVNLMISEERRRSIWLVHWGGRGHERAAHLESLGLRFWSAVLTIKPEFRGFNQLTTYTKKTHIRIILMRTIENIVRGLWWGEGRGRGTVGWKGGRGGCDEKRERWVWIYFWLKKCILYLRNIYIIHIEFKAISLN